MILPLTFLALFLSSLLSLFFSTLTYALRDFARVKLSDELEKRGRSQWLERILDQSADLIFLTAVLRLLSNMLILLCCLRLMAATQMHLSQQYGVAVAMALGITLFVSVAIPHAAAQHASEQIIASFAPFLSLVRLTLRPITLVMDSMDAIVRQASGIEDAGPQEQMEKEILSVVEEGAEQGIVNEQEREMIKSVIEFRDTTAGQIMTARPEIVALDVKAKLQEVKQLIEESGHSRVPVFDGDLDHIVGILYARDLLHHLGNPPEQFDIRSAMRPPFYVPEVKPLSDLLRDFRTQKVHIAIVLDEYGGTAGLVTIEDLLEELVGDISDEHEPQQNPMFKRINHRIAEVDARIYVDELNRLMGLSLPEDAGYNTLSGFVSTTMGRIPETGQSFEHNGHKFSILDAEPQKVNKVRIEAAEQPVEESSPS